MKKYLLGLLLGLMVSLTPGAFVAQAQVLDSSRIIGNTDNILTVPLDSKEYGVKDLVNNSDSKDQEGFKTLMKKIADYMKPFMVYLGIMVIIYAGWELYLSRGKEDVFREKIQQTIYLFIGYILMLMANVIVYQLFFGDTGEIFFDGGDDAKSFAVKTFGEMSGIFDYVTTFAIAILLLVVVLSVFQFMFTAENEDAKDKLIKQLTWGSIGIAILSGAKRLVGFFFEGARDGEITEEGVRLPDITTAGENTMLGELVGWGNFLLGYVSFMAVVTIIGAGIFMVFYFGDDDRINKAKSMMISAVVALIVCFSSWAAINYFLFPSGA